MAGEIPGGFKLNQNYPNPFNPTTNITYNLPDAETVSLVVYNVLGQEMTRLVDNQRQSAGVYWVTWDGRDRSGSKVTTGMYFYQLESGSKQVTKTMILLK